MKYNSDETIQEAQIKHKCGLLLQENGEWLGSQFQHDKADEMILFAEDMIEHEIDDIIMEKYD